LSLRDRLSALEAENAEAGRRIQELETALAAEREQNEQDWSARDVVVQERDNWAKELESERSQRLGECAVGWYLLRSFVH
jgi:hypothetical protein